VAPADSLARLRKALLDRAERKEAPVTQLCAETGISRSRFYELRSRYRAYGEAGLRPKPRPAERPDHQLPEPLVDAIVAYAVEHPTHGQRTIADALARPRFGGWTVSHGGVANVLRRAGLVQAWRSRNRVMYSLADSRIADLLSQVDTLVGADTAGRHLGGLEGMNTTMPTGDGAPEGRARAGDDKAGERPARDPREVPFTPGVGGAA